MYEWHSDRLSHPTRARNSLWKLWVKRVTQYLKEAISESSDVKEGGKFCGLVIWKGLSFPIVLETPQATNCSNNIVKYDSCYLKNLALWASGFTLGDFFLPTYTLVTCPSTMSNSWPNKKIIVKDEELVIFWLLIIKGHFHGYQGTKAIPEKAGERCEIWKNKVTSRVVSIQACSTLSIFWEHGARLPRFTQ